MKKLIIDKMQEKENSIFEQAFQVNNFASISKKGGGTIYHFRDAHGLGEMNCYDVAPGI